MNNTNLELKNLTFIDLFSGIGAFHVALEKRGAKCIYASEWDKYAQKTYFENFGIFPDGDITQIDENIIPDHDILCAGFPCQTFSISGKQSGFEDARGTLFFDVARIIRKKKPKLVLMENVRNFAKHDDGKTIEVVKTTLLELGYTFDYALLNSSDFGLPQSRQRIYMIAIRNDLKVNHFTFPKGKKKKVCLKDILLTNEETVDFIIDRDDIKIDNKKVIDIKEKNEISLKPQRVGIINKGGQGERIYSSLGHAITLSAYGGGPGSKTGCYYVDGIVRKLSPRECARLQGFDDSFKIVVSNSQAWKQFGNSIPINVLDEIIESIISNKPLLYALKNI
ncbi:DNA cytosine methyltransferase [Staphylococcus epidermidis]|nr:DNA cytosine methyltransferase [Staphylococcus epidermidis]